VFDLGLNENQTRLRDLAKKVAEEKLMPFAEKVDEQNRFSWENLDALKSAGFMGLTVPSIYGGGEASEFECVLVQEEITRGSTSAGSLLENHMMATDALLQAASESQKEHYFPRFATAEILGTLAITEPEAGSDVKAIRTLAERVPEGYRINGTKRFISLADVAGAYIVLAKTDPAKRHKGMSTFIVGRTTKGVSLGKKEEKMGQRGLLTADVILEDCVVPDSALLGEENRDLRSCYTHSIVLESPWGRRPLE
jgi:acyl-CoA dehydrogenase